MCVTGVDGFCLLMELGVISGSKTEMGDDARG